MRPVLGEVLTAVVTPFRADGGVDLDTFKRLCAHLVDNGSDGVVVAGTTGEAPTLSDDERLSLFAAAVESDRRPGDGDRRHGHVLHGPLGAPDGAGPRARRRRLPGRHAVLQQAPGAGDRRPLPAIAEATDRPIVVYNIPQRVVVNLEPETLAQLAEIPNVTAVKQATTDPGQARRILEETDLALYAGNDDLCSRSWSWAASAGSSSTRTSWGRASASS